MEMEYVKPQEIEKRSFELIEKELTTVIPEDRKNIVKRVIHTTADFDYEHTMAFSENVVEIAHRAMQSNAIIITDTTMAKSGINKPAMKKLGMDVECFIGDEDVKEEALKNGTTRSTASIDKASRIKDRPVIFAIGNAPTALIRIYELVKEGKLNPALVIGVPVGFVNVEYSKELIHSLDVPYILNMGRKGGSNVAAAIVNALMYQLTR